MEKTLSFTDTSSQTVKIGDTTTSFTLVCGNDNKAVDLTHATSITVKLGNDSGYLKSTKIEPSRLTEAANGKITVTFNDDLMNKLPAGRCAIEVWVVDSTGTSIYPSDGSTGFTITNNIQSTNGSTITTVAFDDFVKELNKAASTIAKGDKGDPGPTGTVDNAGLTKAPAFVELKTQVDNSAVGTNLLIDTETETGTMWFTKGNNLSAEKINGCNVETQIGDWKSARYLFDDLKKRNVINTTDNFVFSAMLRVDPTLKDNPASIIFLSTATDKNNTTIGYIKDYADGYWHQVSVAFKFLTTPTNADTFMQSIRFELGATNGATVYWTQRKLEKGSVATDWCPNPSEILTQSDYAKLRAAILSLGGSLK